MVSRKICKLKHLALRSIYYRLLNLVYLHIIVGDIVDAINFKVVDENRYMVVLVIKIFAMFVVLGLLMMQKKLKI